MWRDGGGYVALNRADSTLRSRDAAGELERGDGADGLHAAVEGFSPLADDTATGNGATLCSGPVTALLGLMHPRQPSIGDISGTDSLL